MPNYVPLWGVSDTSYGLMWRRGTPRLTVDKSMLWPTGRRGMPRLYRGENYGAFNWGNSEGDDL